MAKPLIPESTTEDHRLKFSEVKNYVTLEEEAVYPDHHLLRRIAPTLNSKGLLTVEVSKVVRDLQMLHRSFKQSKFFKMLTEGIISQEDSQTAEHSEDFDSE